MPLLVYTSRLPHHGCDGYRGPDALDVTRGSGGERGNPFAPSRALLAAGQAAKTAAKRKSAPGGATADERLDLWFAMYREFYLVELRESYRSHRSSWEALLQRHHIPGRERVVLCCYCGSHRCHRRILAEVLGKLGAVDCGELKAA